MKPASNTDELLRFDICIIGAGSGGLSVAAGAARMGANVVLIERGKMGGDCLNTGCVPSKSLIAAAHAAHAAAVAPQFGVRYGPVSVNYRNVHAHIHDVIAGIAPHDSIERFEALGVKVIMAQAAFTSPEQVVAGGIRVRARRFVIATGSKALLPPVEGLGASRPLTNESVFDLQQLPRHLLILGGGPIGLELAQAFRRLGSEVTVLVRSALLPRDEPEAAAIIRKRFGEEGIHVREHCQVKAVRRTAKFVEALVSGKDGDATIRGSDILVAAGREANVESLGLDVAGIRFQPGGIDVDAGLRTSNRKVYAIGDVAGGPQFTHVAGYHAGIVIRSALLGLPAKVNYAALPWVTYTDPEIAHVGLTEAEARRKHPGVTVRLETFLANDRARTERRTEGFVKIVLGGRGRILGATIAAPHAGEMIGTWALAISQNLALSAIAGLILPYPTLSELSKKVAGDHFAPLVFGKTVRAAARFVQRWLP